MPFTPLPDTMGVGGIAIQGTGGIVGIADPLDVMSYADYVYIYIYIHMSALVYRAWMSPVHICTEIERFASYCSTSAANSYNSGPIPSQNL